jgi:alkylhydroperoxidase family enzyme
MDANDRAGVTVNQPRTKDERVRVAQSCGLSLKMTMPLLVDEIDDRVGHAYSGMPDRLYVIDTDGKVAYKGGRGPFGFNPGEMEQSLVMLLTDQASRAKAHARVPLLDDAAAWKRLPLTGPDAGKPLPVWACTLARTLPTTTACMLELDQLHRAKSPLEPKLRASMRWVAAHTNRCEYSQAVALADLRRAGASAAEIARVTGPSASWPAEYRDALGLARTLTRSGHDVTDAEVAALSRRYGDKKLVAMVLMLAHANFQDRLCLTLGLKPGPGADRPPLRVKLDPARVSKTEAPARRKPTSRPGPGPDGPKESWGDYSAADLQKLLGAQQERKGRIRVPTWEEVQKTLPTASSRGPVKIRWSLVCMGYQPELARGWGNCTRNFGREARQDRVFEETLFWVVTRSLQCFY